jgi:PleD family two-component response regulator
MSEQAGLMNSVDNNRQRSNPRKINSSQLKKLLDGKTKDPCTCKRILIVDDNNFNIMALQVMLKEIEKNHPDLNLDNDSVRKFFVNL